MAISHLGIGKEIANVETEQSEEANACRRFYEESKEATLSDLDWTFATSFAVLNLITVNPSAEWNFSYRYPVDCINIRRILSGLRDDTQASRIPFKLLKDNQGLIIYTDKELAEIEYTDNVVNTELFSSEFNLALSFRLASLIAPRLTGGDPFKMKAEMLNQYTLEMSKAKKKNLNEEVSDRQRESEFITTRG